MSWKFWKGDGEACFEFIEGDRHVVVSIELDGVAYAYRDGPHFVPGRILDPCADPSGFADEVLEAISTPTPSQEERG